MTTIPTLSRFALLQESGRLNEGANWPEGSATTAGKMKPEGAPPQQGGASSYSQASPSTPSLTSTNAEGPVGTATAAASSFFFLGLAAFFAAGPSGATSAVSFVAYFVFCASRVALYSL